ncbi:RNA polymerase sigma-70 factor, ECF subfamily [Catalinimonas alkaloidigena]|uniref:RNA polymerase sigma-70 factor, ECF subfamily n=1 Tax=Catalinimonas alkaloidigena TaxID=1075417 RepID=A0A1G9N746_9BACT|nr:sigma-70 family RNA polymerase sigma factor [Catalinimonas alkaloidigena]SDL82356.1 RNA polymerase sigma-70 factor, ECF subfamily [Catalinimonas alkaloidigena]
MDQEPFLALLEANKHRVLRICRAYASDQATQQDLFQEVVLQLWQSFETFRGDAHRATWLYRIALNVCIKAKCKLDRHQRRQVQLEGIQFRSESHEPTWERQERHALLHRCIAALPEADRSLVVLFLEGMAYREIAEVVGISENHVAVKMKRIKEKLRTCLPLELYE